MGPFRFRGCTELPHIWETKRQSSQRCWPERGIQMSEGPFKLPSCLSCSPLPSTDLPSLFPPLTRHPVVALTAAFPPCFIYLFCTNRVAADSFSPGLKRERERKKRKNASWLFSLPQPWQQQRQQQQQCSSCRAAGAGE